jgi:hypothetical protein
MKKGVYVFAALVMVMLAACPTEPESTPKGPQFGEKLTLSGEVRTLDISIPYITYSPFKEKWNISDSGMGGSGKINKGKLSYSIGKPKPSSLIPIATLPTNNVVIQPPTANIALLSLTIDNADFPSLTRELITSNIMSRTLTAETVSYIYVDTKVTITADNFSYADVISNIPIKLTSPTTTLELKKGWNAVNATLEALLTVKSLGTPPDIEADGSLNIKLGNPSSLYWVVDSVYDGSLPFYNYRLP